MFVEAKVWTETSDASASGRTQGLRLGRVRTRAAASRVVWLLSLVSVLALAPCEVSAQGSYQKPPQVVLDVLDAPVAPGATLSPTREHILLAHDVRYPPIGELAQPVRRLAGLRINPQTNGLFRMPYSTKLRLITVADGSEREIAFPPGAQVGFPLWSPDGRHFVFSNTTPRGVELWVGEASKAKAKRMTGVVLNAAYGPAAFGPAARWMPDGKSLLVQLVPSNRGEPPAASPVPDKPLVQETTGPARTARTFQDLLKSPQDEKLFEYYATWQMALLDMSSGKLTPVGAPAIFQSVEPSPDGRHLLVARVTRPFSYLLPHTSFPREVEVWDLRGKVLHKLASLPLADKVPVDGVLTGPRVYAWRPTGPATLVWVEALDGGDPKAKVTHRDRLVGLAAPFDKQPVELARTEHRLVNFQWGERDGLLLVSEFDRSKRWGTTSMLNADAPAPPKVVWSLSVDDRYNNPGSPVTRSAPNGSRVVIQHGDFIYLAGPGASPEGERPFLDRFDLKTLKAERLFRSEATNYEAVITLLKDDASQVLTRLERPDRPLNLYVRNLSAPDAHPQPIGERAGTNGNHAEASSTLVPPRALTHFPDPTPQIRGIKKQLVTYKRADGVDLSFTLYLPAGYTEGTRLPTVLWAYPQEFAGAATAGQVAGSAQRFTTFTGPSPLFFVLQGYAVLHNASMPVVGTPETVNNTFVEQIEMNARAAVEKAVALGVADPERVGIAGHSYGAFMVANVLAHSDLFRAGVALSGAYNRTLTPFGFQNEKRNLWEAPELYVKVSPFMNAHKINEPLLLVHGEADENEGTFPMQSERMFQAMRGTGGTARLVVLPLEAHTYAARESIEHTLYEMLSWFDKYVKNAPPRAAAVDPKAKSAR